MKNIEISFEVDDDVTAEQLHDNLCRAIHEGEAIAQANLEQWTSDINMASKPMILDFGTDGGQGLSFATHWLEEYDADPRKMFEDHGYIILNAWVKSGISGVRTPIPAENEFFDMIHARWSMCHNYLREWPYIFQEFKRVLKPGGMIVITDLVEGAEADYNQIREIFTEAFTCDRNYVDFVKLKEIPADNVDERGVEISAVIYRE